MSITWSSILLVINKTVDILLVWMLFYYLFKILKHNSKLSLIIKGILFLIAIKIVADLLNLVTIGLILEQILVWGPIALIIIFQPEIRTMLEELGKKRLLSRKKVLTVDEREKIVNEIVDAMYDMHKSKTGALIVIERDVSLYDYIIKAKKVNSSITSDMLKSLFFPNNPMHDGGVIIQGDTIVCAGAVFPTSNSTKISKSLGTRHRAAVGISEESDAISLVVSEETGKISMAIAGDLHVGMSKDDIKMTLIDELRPNRESASKEEEIYEENK